jgi:hypothetical protein
MTPTSTPDRARRDHAARCAVHAIRLAVIAATDADAARLTDSACRFLALVLQSNRETLARSTP